MERWRKTWRHHVSLFIPTPALLALREGLIRDDPRLTQGSTVLPVGVRRQSTKCQGACAIGYAFWMGFGMQTVADVWHAFEDVYDSCDLEERVCQHFVKWFDRTPRDEMRAELLAEVERTLVMRKNLSDAAGVCLGDWLAVAERVYGGACGGPAGKGAKGKPRKRKAARRELVSC